MRLHISDADTTKDVVSYLLDQDLVVDGLAQCILPNPLAAKESGKFVGARDAIVEPHTRDYAIDDVLGSAKTQLARALQNEKFVDRLAQHAGDERRRPLLQ